jgi:hypothetical protein
MLCERPARDVCREAGVTEEGGVFMLPSLGAIFAVNARARTITGTDARARALLDAPRAAADKLSVRDFAELLYVRYLAGARHMGLTGRLLKPELLKGGHHFFKGAHELPLARIASRYGADRAAFLERAARLGGVPAEYGDASAVLHTVPRVPITMILRLGDDEFPPRADLLFDSSCELQLPLDVLWSAAMLACLPFLDPPAEGLAA